jgi:hypothetical protein
LGDCRHPPDADDINAPGRIDTQAVYPIGTPITYRMLTWEKLRYQSQQPTPLQTTLTWWLSPSRHDINRLRIISPAAILRSLAPKWLLVLIILREDPPTVIFRLQLAGLFLKILYRAKITNSLAAIAGTGKQHRIKPGSYTDVFLPL